MKNGAIGVCIVVENLPVPLDRRVWQEALALRDAGYRVSVICPKRGEYQSAYDSREGIEIYRHSLWEASRPAGYLLEYAWAFIQQLRLGLKAYRRRRFHFLHACNPPDTIFLVGCFFRLLGVRFTFDQHDLNPELYEVKFGKKGGLFYRLVCLAERLTFGLAVVSFAPNDSYREIAIQRGGMRPEQTFVVRSSPGEATTHAGRAVENLKRGKRYLVLYLGVMGPQEGLELLLESILQVEKWRQKNDTQYVLIGAGSELPRLKQRVAEMDLRSVVHFTGRLPDRELPLYLSTADVGVAPDPKNVMNDKSTMNKVLEYMAYGRPVVLYDLMEGRRAAAAAALYARPNDPEDFARQIVTLLDSDALRLQLGEEGKRRIAGELRWELQKAELLRGYETALNASPGKRRSHRVV
ncbi:MAG: glycosyltransferase family 4 protein [Terriglobia bacterium]